MAKKVTGFVKLQIPAGKANPAPPVGTALGPQGINIMAFCKEFNARTQGMGDLIIPVLITAYADKTFTFITKTPPATHYLKQAVNLKSGAKTTGREVVGKITRTQLRDIATKKMKDLNANDVEAAAKIIEGSARSMGLQIVER